jgi:hypothetical protein
MPQWCVQENRGAEDSHSIDSQLCCQLRGSPRRLGPRRVFLPFLHFRKDYKNTIGGLCKNLLAVLFHGIVSGYNDYHLFIEIFEQRMPRVP